MSSRQWYGSAVCGGVICERAGVQICGRTFKLRVPRHSGRVATQYSECLDMWQLLMPDSIRDPTAKDHGPGLLYGPHIIAHTIFDRAALRISKLRMHTYGARTSRAYVRLCTA